MNALVKSRSGNTATLVNGFSNDTDSGPEYPFLFDTLWAKKIMINKHTHTNTP